MNKKPKFSRFLKFGGFPLSKTHSAYVRELWADKASKTMLKKPGCIASACCFLQIDGKSRMMLFMAHTRQGGYVRWSTLGDRKVLLPTVHTLQPSYATNIHGTSFLRDGDAEFLLLNYIATKWKPKQLTGGYIVMHVEIQPCTSCAAVIRQFKGMYRGVELHVLV